MLDFQQHTRFVDTRRNNELRIKSKSNNRRLFLLLAQFVCWLVGVGWLVGWHVVVRFSLVTRHTTHGGWMGA